MNCWIAASVFGKMNQRKDFSCSVSLFCGLTVYSLSRSFPGSPADVSDNSLLSYKECVL